MSGNRDSNTRKQADDQWRWLLIDAVDERILVADDIWADGRSLRRVVPDPLRHSMAGAIQKCIETAAPVGPETVTVRGAPYTRELRPVLGPGGDLRAVLAYIGPASIPIPPPLRVGAWQWDITAHVTTWAPEMRDLYGVPGQGGVQFTARQYFELLAPTTTEYPMMQQWITEAEAAPTGVRHGRLFRIRRQDTGTVRIMVNSARVDRTGGTPVMRGITADVTHLDPPMWTGADTLSRITQSMMELSPDLWLLLQPQWQVSVAVLVSDRAEDVLGVPIPDTGRLLDVFHPDDVRELETLITDGAREARWGFRVRRRDGQGWRTLVGQIRDLGHLGVLCMVRAGQL